MNLQENISLKPYNTFGIEAKAKYLAAFESLPELEELHDYKLQTLNLFLAAAAISYLRKILMESF